MLKATLTLHRTAHSTGVYGHTAHETIQKVAERVGVHLDPKQITLFDVDYHVPGHGRALSPSVWKTRYSLNFKRLPFRAHFVPLSRIEGLSKALGIPPSVRRFDGRPLWTLPIIFDPHTNLFVKDSFSIAEYLDARHPTAVPGAPTSITTALRGDTTSQRTAQDTTDSTRLLIKPGTKTFTKAFVHARELAFAPLHQFVVPLTLSLIPDEESRVYFRKTRKEWFGVEKIEDIRPTRGSGKYKREWEKVKRGFSLVNSWYDRDNSRDAVWVMGTLGRGLGDLAAGEGEKGEQGEGLGGPCFADFNIAASLLWMRTVWGEGSEEWNEVRSWDEGRWERLLSACKTYQN